LRANKDFRDGISAGAASRGLPAACAPAAGVWGAAAHLQSTGGGILGNVQRSSVDDGMSDVLQKGNTVHTKKSDGYVPCSWAQGVERHMGVAYLQY